MRRTLWGDVDEEHVPGQMTVDEALPRRRCLELFSAAGGSARGYELAGFEVTCVDTVDHGNPVGTFVQADAFAVLRGEAGIDCHDYDLITASPPCFDHSALRSLSGGSGTGWMLAETLRLLQRIGRPYIVENVPGARDLMPGALQLCGSEFGLGARCRDGRWRALRRHRLFSSNVWLMGAGGCGHGRSEVIGVYGDGAQRGVPRAQVQSKVTGGDPYRGNLAECRAAMGIDWMTRRQLSLAIPPVYTQFLGEQVQAHLDATAPPARTRAGGVSG